MVGAGGEGVNKSLSFFFTRRRGGAEMRRNAGGHAKAKGVFVVSCEVHIAIGSGGR